MCYVGNVVTLLHSATRATLHTCKILVGLLNCCSIWMLCNSQAYSHRWLIVSNFGTKICFNPTQLMRSEKD